jgi:alpha-beta hydrolase superfamily lysophospholipase
MSHYEFSRSAFDGLSLYFQGWQTDIEPKGVICLVHGLGEHSGRYVHWAGFLNLAGYTVLAYDLRGHGKSGGQRGHVSSFDEYLHDTDLLLKEANDRFPSQPHFLYGHSIGGLIVSYYVLQRKPELSGVVITGLANKTSVQEQKGKVFLAKLLGALLPKFSMASGLNPSSISRDPEEVSKYKNDSMVHNRVSAGFGKGTLDVSTWIDQHASEWTLPVLFMHGDKDQIAYVKGSIEFSSKIKGDCTLKIWPGLFHEVHNEPEKEQVFEYLRNWLDTHTHAS